MARDRDTPPDGEVFIVSGDGSPDPMRPPPAGHRFSSTGRRIAAVLVAAVVFVFGVVVGRTSNPGRSSGGAPTPSPSAQTLPSSTAPAPTAPNRSPSPSARTGTSPAPTAGAGSAGETPAPMLNSALTAAIQLPIPGPTDIQSVTVLDGQVVALARGYLARVSYGGHGGLRPDGATAVGLPVGDPSYAAWRLVTDGRNLWAISLGGANRVYLIDPATLQLGPEWNVEVSTSPVVDAAGMDGHLYLNTSSGVVDVTPTTRRIGPSDVVARGGQAMAADPTRHRLLLLNHDTGWMVYAYAPPGFHLVASASLPFEAQSIAVADGEIWVTGTRDGPDAPRPVLARLDPTTLRVVAHSELEGPLTSAPTIVAHGQRLWIRSKAGGDQLWCVDPRSGAVAQHWLAVPGVVTEAGGAAFVADGSAVGQLDDTACTG